MIYSGNLALGNMFIGDAITVLNHSIYKCSIERKFNIIETYFKRHFFLKKQFPFHN